MMKVFLPRESIEKLSCTITADVDPTTLTVRFSFTVGSSRPTTWTAGSWLGAATSAGGRFTATALTPLVGAGGLDLEPGPYTVWAQLDGPTEDPVMHAGELQIT